MSFIRTWKSALFAAVAVAAPILAPSSAGAVESSDPIKIVLFDWTSVNLNAKILAACSKSSDTPSSTQLAIIFRA